MIKISLQEWKFIALVTGVVLVLSSLLYIFAASSAPENRHFMGFILNVSDHAQYLSWYKAFQSGFLISNLLTSESNRPLFFNLLWFILGRIGLYTGIDYAWIYQIFRWISGISFALMVYISAAWFFPSILHRKFAFLTIILGSGLGWILVVMKYTITRGELLFPLDLYVAEGNSFLSLLGYPHFLEASAFILLIFWLLLIGEERQKFRYPFIAAVAAFLLGWQHGYDLVIVWSVPLGYIGVRWLIDRVLPVYWIKALILLIIISWPPALYAVLLTRFDPLWQEVLAQFANAGVYTPTPPHMLILMGLPLLVAIMTFLHYLRLWWSQRQSLRSSARNLAFLCTWFLVGWGLCYLPTDFQIHMINSWQVPVGLLATAGFLDYFLPRFNFWRMKNAPQRVMGLALLLIIPTNIYLLAWRFVDLNRHDYPYYIYQGEYQALKWLEHNAPAGAVIMSAMEVGQFIPGISGKKAFLGHWAQTVNFYAKRDVVKEFFDLQTGEERRREIINQYDVDYVFWGMVEQELGRYNPDYSYFLSKVYEAEQVKIYAVSDLFAEMP